MFVVSRNSRESVMVGGAGGFRHPLNDPMRAATLILLPILLLSLSRDALAQSGGMFGPRVLGSTVRPGVSQFDGGLQLAPSGAFVGTGRPNGANMFARPWQHASELPLYVPFAYGVLSNGQLVAIPSNEIMPGGTTVPVAVPSQPAVVAETVGQPEALPAQQIPAGHVPAGQPASQPLPAAPPTPAGGATFYYVPAQPVLPLVAAATAAASGLTGSVVKYTALPTFSPEEPGPAPEPGFTINAGLNTGYLPGLSESLTRIARDHGMQVSSPIRVSVVNGTAILRGVVGSPHERELIANMARLEPGIERISNQLIVASEGLAPAK